MASFLLLINLRLFTLLNREGGVVLCSHKLRLLSHYGLGTYLLSRMTCARRLLERQIDLIVVRGKRRHQGRFTAPTLVILLHELLIGDLLRRLLAALLI